MSIVNKVAEPYAEALLDLAASNDTLKETTNDMNIVSQFLVNSSDLTKFLGNPLITRDAKKNVVKDILGEQISSSTLKFLLLLVDKANGWKINLSRSFKPSQEGESSGYHNSEASIVRGTKSVENSTVPFLM